MKKIVGIIAAVAMAASVFAVDFSAGFQLKGNLFKYENSGNMEVLTLSHENTKDDKPFIFTVNGDRAGGQLKFYDAGKSTGVIVDTVNTSDWTGLAVGYWSIWFSPFANFKVELGNSDTKLNCEQITWWKGKVWGAGEWGYKATYSADALSISLFLKDSWLTKTASTAVAETALVVGYNADFGNLTFVFDGKDTFDTLIFGAGYKGSFGSSTIFTDVAFTKKATANALAFDVDYKYSADGITAEIYSKLASDDISNFGDNMQLMLMFKGAYALNGGSLYLKFLDDDILADSFAAEIELGYDGNLGAIAYNVAANYNTSSKAFAVPFWVRLSF